AALPPQDAPDPTRPGLGRPRADGPYTGPPPRPPGHAPADTQHGPCAGQYGHQQHALSPRRRAHPGPRHRDVASSPQRRGQLASAQPRSGDVGASQPCRLATPLSMGQTPPSAQNGALDHRALVSPSTGDIWALDGSDNRHTTPAPTSSGQPPAS